MIRPKPSHPAGHDSICVIYRRSRKMSTMVIVYNRLSLSSQVLGGKTPCRAMLKWKVRNGIILLWG